MLSTRFWFTALSVSLSACGDSSANRVDESRILEPGTYQIEICRGDCIQPLARGFLVLFDQPMDPKAFPDSALDNTFFESGTGEWTFPVACFALSKRDAAANTYAGLVPFGITRWAGPSDSAQSITLYRSPDAGYDLLVRTMILPIHRVLS